MIFIVTGICLSNYWDFPLWFLCNCQTFDGRDILVEMVQVGQCGLKPGP